MQLYACNVFQSMFMYLTISEHSEDVEFCIRCKAQTLPWTGHNTSYKRTMAKSYKLKVQQQVLSNKLN